MYYRINENGYYLGVFSESNEGMEFYTQTPITGNFVKHKFNGQNWIEGATEEEIYADYLNKNLPQEVALWRVRAILSLLNKEQDVINAINQLPEPQKTGALYIWNYGTIIERNSQTILFIQNILQMTDFEVNEIFINANNIQI